MKFTHTPHESPKIGDTRTVTRFAWLPTRMSDDTVTVWLERYDSKEVFTTGLSVTGYGWCVVWRKPRYSLGA